MRELILKSRVLNIVDYKNIDIFDKLPEFKCDIHKLEEDIKRYQYANGTKEEVDIVEKNDLVYLSCKSTNLRFNKENIYVVVGRNVWDKDFEEKLIGCEKNVQTELIVNQDKVTVEIKNIVRTNIPKLNDENVKKWNIEKVETVEDLKKLCFSRQISNFYENEEEAEFVTSHLFLEYLKNGEFVIEEDEMNAMRKTVDTQLNEAKQMRQKMIESGEIDPNDGCDIDSMAENMIIQTIKAAIIGFKKMKDNGYVITEEDYFVNIENRKSYAPLTTEELKQRYTETEFILETCSCYFFDEIEAYVKNIMNEVYYERNKKRIDGYDVAIIGAGPAGLSAALTLNVHNKNIVWFGTKELSNKVEKSEMIVNYAGFDSITGKELNNHFRNQIEKNHLELTDKMVTQISKTKDGFMILADNEFYKVKTVLLAIGAVTSKGIENEQRLLGHGVSYCATCDGFLYQGKAISVFCNNPRYEHEIEYLASIASKVYCYCAYPNSNIQAKNVIMLDKPMKRVLGHEKVEGIVLTDGSKITVDGAFFLRDSVAPSTMLKELEIDGAHILTTRNMETNIRGCYAAGDITGRPYQIAKAVGEGNIAAHAIVEYLTRK